MWYDCLILLHSTKSGLSFGRNFRYRLHLKLSKWRQLSDMVQNLGVKINGTERSSCWQNFRQCLFLSNGEASGENFANVIIFPCHCGACNSCDLGYPRSFFLMHWVYFRFQFYAEGAETHPLGRVGKAHEVSSAILFLASDAASFTTGAIFPVDGGRLCTISKPAVKLAGE